MIKYIKEHLAVKIFIVTVGVLLMVCILLYGMIVLGISHSYIAELDESIDRQMEQIVEQIPEISEDEMKGMISMFAMEHVINISIRNDDGNEVGNYGSIAYDISPVINTNEKQENTGITKSYTASNKEGEKYHLLVFGDRQQTNAVLNSLSRVFPMLGMVTFLAALITAAFYARYVTKPILAISDVSRRMADLKFDVRCLENREDELGILGENLNHLAERLEESLRELHEKNKLLQHDIIRKQQIEQEQMAFFSAVSHELKTPVTILKGQIQGMLYNIGGYKDRDKYLKRSGEVVNSLEEMVQEILEIARIKSKGFSLNMSAVDMKQLIKEVLKDMEDIAIDKGLQLNISLSNIPVINADRSFMKKVLNNLVGNAIKYSEAEANIWIDLYEENKSIVFSVENETSPIPEEEIPKLFEAFYRREQSRNRMSGGSGLGLYIVKMILELHHFQYNFVNTKNGIRMRIICPIV